MYLDIFGMDIKEVLKRFPSYVHGSLLQTLASHQQTKDYKRNPNNPHAMFVPGLFCSPSVFNNLGKRIEDKINIHTPRPFPYWFSMACNIASVEKSANELYKDLNDLATRGITEISLIGHSLGGIIILTALSTKKIPCKINKVILMATPLKGSPITKLLGFIPACKDIQPNSDIIKSLKYSYIDITLISENDSIVPSEYQMPSDLSKSNMYYCENFQHMDFFVGSDEKVNFIADILTKEIV